MPARDVRRRRASPRRRVGWLPVFATAAAVVFLILAGRSLLLSAGGAPGVSALPSQGRASAVIASPSIAAPATPTATPSPTPRPSVDPALSALDAVDAAIAAARGGPDGLKGKEANELESQVARVRHDLASGDRAAALRDARALDRRARDAADHLHGDAASRLTSATARLVDALGG